MRFRVISPRLAFAVSSVALALAFAPLACGQAQIVQTMESFYSPSAAVFVPGGQTLFVANAARGEYGMFAGRGAISKVSVAADGKLTIESLRFIDGLNAPLGLALLPAPSGPFPAGTLVATVGASFTVDASGKRLPDDKSRGTGLAFFDPVSGKELGRVHLGQGSPVRDIVGHPVVDPIGVTADAAGNIYVADVAGADGRPIVEVEVRAGVIKLTSAAIDALAKGETPTKESVAFAHVQSIPAGIGYSARDNALYWATSNGIGEIFRAARGDFSATGSLETVAKEAGSISGIGITANGSVIAGRNDGDVVVWRKKGRARVLKFRNDLTFLLPGQIATTTLADGKVLVVLPELSGGGRGPWHQRVQVFTLPKDY